MRDWYCDPSKPESIGLFQEAGIPAEKANNSVYTGIQSVRQKLMIRDRQPMLTLSNQAVYTATEFEQYQWASNRDGMKDQPLKTNDHTMDALRYLIMGAEASSKFSNISIDSSQWA